MTISVALCTYNGARFLQEQLESIAVQTRLPDELVVCDDGSTDSTIAILEAFAVSAPFPVRIFVNDHNLRSTKNFEKAIRLCQGELIALSDQDDVWLPHKLARLDAAFMAEPKVGLVFTDAEIVDEHLQPLGSRLWTHIGFGPQRQRMMQQGRAFDVQLAENVVTGATMAFRSDLNNLILPIPDDIAIIHDGWIALMIAAVRNLMFLEEPLILYRQHSAQQMGVRGGVRPKVLPKSHYQAHQRQLRSVHERLSMECRRGISPELDDLPARLEAWDRHLQARLDLPDARIRRLPSVLRELLTRRYHRFSNGFASVARDLIY